MCKREVVGYICLDEDDDFLGGAARFKTILNKYKHLDPIVTFGGDWVGPSLLSSFTRGLHMAEVLELMEVHYGTHGNHDFDFGTARLEELTHKPVCFPPLLPLLPRKSCSSFVLLVGFVHPTFNFRYYLATQKRAPLIGFSQT